MRTLITAAILLLPLVASAVDFSDKFILRGKDGVEIPSSGHSPNLDDGTILNGGDPVIYGSRQTFAVEVLSQRGVGFPAYGMGQSANNEYWRLRKPSQNLHAQERIYPSAANRFLATYPKDTDFFTTTTTTTTTGTAAASGFNLGVGSTAPRGLIIEFDVWFFPRVGGEQTATVELILLDANVLATHAIGEDHADRVFRFDVQATAQGPGADLTLTPSTDTHLDTLPSIAGQARSLLTLQAEHTGAGDADHYYYRVISARYPNRSAWSRAEAVDGDLDVTVLVDRSTPLTIQALAIDSHGDIIAYDIATNVLVGPDLTLPGQPLERDSQGLTTLQREAMGESIQHQPRMISEGSQAILEWRRNTTMPHLEYTIQRSRDGSRWVPLQGLTSTVHATDGDYEIMRTPIPAIHTDSWFRVLITDPAN
ncbi:MAG: hypothetical protein JJT75_14970 [Opitutales bacterium]|nr:hypothetical protein [Opitutales bacterium]